MAKTSKMVPQKEAASSSQPTGGKTLVEPCLEECIPGGCALNSDFKIDKASSIPGRCERMSRYICSITEGYLKQIKKDCNWEGMGKDTVMRPTSGEEETSTPVPKLVKDKKRKRTSTSEDPKPKKNPVCNSKKDIVALPTDVIQRLKEEEEEDEDDGSELVARVKKTTEAPKAAESVVVEEILPRAKGVLEKDSGKVPESSKIKDASYRDEQKAGMSEGGSSEALRSEENAPSGSLGALALHREAFSKSKAELSRCEADPRGLTEERNALKLLSGQKEEEIKDLRAELAKAHQDQADLIEQLRAMKEKISAQAKKIEKLEAWLAFELAKAKSEAEKAKAEAETIVASTGLMLKPLKSKRER
ncbi:uncharacterized protein [Nicotiana tomentosiformis]|uniref:uncharacterized protein n=1 Tax=Nicotiana tomentosiformis TaxID=4098 RepID=UPI00388CA214